MTTPSRAAERSYSTWSVGRLADGQLWESRDRGDNWTPLQFRSGALDALVALAFATH